MLVDLESLADQRQVWSIAVDYKTASDRVSDTVTVGHPQEQHHSAVVLVKTVAEVETAEEGDIHPQDCVAAAAALLEKGQKEVEGNNDRIAFRQRRVSVGK